MKRACKSKEYTTVYVAGPYNAYTNEQREHNADKAVLEGKRVIELGGVPVIPHVYHCYYGLRSEPWFRGATAELLKRCDCCIVHGNKWGEWDGSKGTVSEVRLCVELKKPVFIGEDRYSYLARFLGGGLDQKTLGKLATEASRILDNLHSREDKDTDS